MIAKVILETMQNAKKLVNIVEHISCDVELCSGECKIYARSTQHARLQRRGASYSYR